VRLWRTAHSAWHTYITPQPTSIEAACALDDRQHAQDHNRVEAYGVPLRALVYFHDYGTELSDRRNRFVVDISIQDFLMLAPYFGYLSDPKQQNEDEIRDELGLGPKW